MPDPIIFPSSTPALNLPLLMAGQAQKEFFLNQALSLLDALHARAVTGSQAAPPAAAQEGACFRVTAPATGAWAGHEDDIAVLIGGEWQYIVPGEGLQVFDRAANQMVVFRSQWRPASAPANPTGGTVIDIEARAAVTALIQALSSVGILGFVNA